MSSWKRKVFYIDLNVLRHSDLLYSVVGRTYQWVGAGPDKNKLMYTVIRFAGHHRRKTQDRSCKLISWILYLLNRIMAFISIDIPISFSVQVHDTFIYFHHQNAYLAHSKDTQSFLVSNCSIYGLSAWKSINLCGTYCWYISQLPLLFTTLSIFLIIVRLIWLAGRNRQILPYW